MRTIWMWLVMASALIGAPAWAKAKGKAKPKSKPDVVVLAFGWPNGLGADVTYQSKRTKKSIPVFDISFAMRMNVTAEGDMFRVAYRNWKKDPSGNPAGGMAAPSLENIATIVDKKGAFVRVDGGLSGKDAAGVAATVSARGGKDPAPEVTKQVAQMVPMLFRQNTENTWQMLVGTWAGGELEIGADYETDAEGPVPLLPGETMKQKLYLRAERRLDCPGNPGKRCVELRLRQEPDRESMAKVVEKIGAKFGTKGLGAEAGDISASEEFTLITEPERLIPYRLDVTKTVGKLGAPESAQVDRTTWTFVYASAPSTGPSK
jgi:hypothetical protein